MVALGTVPHPKKCSHKGATCLSVLGFCADFLQGGLFGGLVFHLEDRGHFLGNITDRLLQSEVPAGIGYQRI